MQLNTTYLSAQQAYIDNALATSKATYNLVIVGVSSPMRALWHILPVSAVNALWPPAVGLLTALRDFHMCHIVALDGAATQFMHRLDAPLQECLSRPELCGMRGNKLRFCCKGVIACCGPAFEVHVACCRGTTPSSAHLRSMGRTQVPTRATTTHGPM